MSQVQYINLDQLFRNYLIRRGFIKTLTQFEAELKADLRVKKLHTKSAVTQQIKLKDILCSTTSDNNKDISAQSSARVKKFTFEASNKKLLNNSFITKTSPLSKTIFKRKIEELSPNKTNKNNNELKSSVTSVTYIQTKKAGEIRRNNVFSDTPEGITSEKMETNLTSLEENVTKTLPEPCYNIDKAHIETVLPETSNFSDEDDGLFDPYEGCSADVFCQCIRCRLKFQEVPVQVKPEGKQVYFCNLCNTKVRTALTLKHHKDTNCGQLKLFTCDACGKHFSYQISLKKHYTSVHLGLKPESKVSYKCRLCSAAFCWEYGLKRHVRNIHASVGVSHVCRLCKKAFPCESYLRGHVKRQHEAEQVKCDHCLKVFTNKIQLKNHMQRVNEKGIRPTKIYPCLMRQICEICGKSIKGRKNLSLHILNKHTENEKSELSMCEICGKGFKSKRGLHIHSLTHSTLENEHSFFNIETQTYTCDVCDKSFRRSKWLFRHLRKHGTSENEIKLKFSCNI